MTFDKKQWNKEYYKKNRKRLLEGSKNWNKKHKKEMKAIRRKWRIKNAEKNRKLANDWAKNNKEYVLHNAKIQNYKRKNAEGSHTLQEWEELKKKFDYTCQRCGKKEPEIKLTRDHIISIKKGGTSYINNIQPLCKKCNCSKREF